MMPFERTAEQRQLQELAREYVGRELRQVAREIEDRNEPLSRERLRQLGEMGFLGINVDRRLGGQGLSDLDALLVLEEFAKLHPAVAFPVFESCVGPIKAIERFGGETLKARLVPQVCRGESTVAIAMSEPGAGTALTDLTTRIVEREGEWIVNGQKRWCSGGGHAEGYLVYCRFGEIAGANGIGAVYVERDRQGVSFGKREHLERCGNATMCLGLAAGALAEAIAYVQERRQFGKPIVEFQAVQLKLAEMAMQVEASRLMIHRAVTAADAEFPSVLMSSMAKCFANETARDVCGKAVQLMGGYGYSKAFAAEQRLRDAWGWGIAGGTIDIQKVNIASALIGRRFRQRG
jgi:alkylation response protein AidB-like acyl-CoA dehydrogenase